MSICLASLSFVACPKKVPPPELDRARELVRQASQVAPELKETELAKKYLDIAEKNAEEGKMDLAKVNAQVAIDFAQLAIKKAEEKPLEFKPEVPPQPAPEPVEKPLPPPTEIKGISPDEIAGYSTLGKGYVLKSLKKVYFAFDSWALSDEAKRTIEENAKIIKPILEQNPNVNLLIEGHCDERGTNEYNLELGWKRAQAVKKYLILLGIPEDRIETLSFGEEFPEAPCPPPQCHDEEKWRKNRRAVFVITVR